jgi:acetyl-CoA carboxylase biotin carboxyl carrier protein
LERVEAPVTGSVWKVDCSVGDEVGEGQTLVILESMKMEIPVEAEAPGRVSEVTCSPGEAITEGSVLVVLE